MKGDWAEALACRYLLGKGYTLLGRNRRTPYGEIDLWMQDGPTYVAVEVKQRRDAAFGTPIEALTPAKYRRIYRSVLHLLGRDDVMVRFEAVLVYGTEERHRLEHLRLEP
ncbi:MAG: YraN family protein [Meiothermus sp.]|uniref:YraN family protein n=1 Tax=Meiothermus sp. TaxID=1955249 RepID=UPI0025FC0E66|nr:YraN family protein [Meiothermus sp.]MCS7057663.1 YraN family protein [Meiothermus sp.]MCS7193472.1 YraN family protein [Meiothermus sp.]MCX7741055.1 YraN family protein [Meiothermus sp.]MDW8090874.1 YraN family protein [Meiothermus sp.]MDW8482431.1 YraN family protein [Meiothermus sp.]